MTTIFRYRPSNAMTIDELQYSYLWFSRPTEYKDCDDSNIIAFAETNENVKESFNRVFEDYIKLGEKARYSGICCFTEFLPDLKDWKCFPKGHDGIFIEYDKEVLEEHFARIYGIGDCFKKVEYLTNQLVVKSSSAYDILWETVDNGFIYKSFWEIEHDCKLMDNFFLKLFTRISDCYIKQNELRVILGGRNIPDNSPDLKGYKVQVPINSIKNIYTQPSTKDTIVAELEKLISKEMSLIKLTK